MALQTWAAELGCCPMCSMAIAIAAVEREAGRAWEPSHKCTEHRMRGELGCMDRAKKHWANRPKVAK